MQGRVRKADLREGDYWIILDDEFYIAHELSRDGGVITADIYRNLSSYEAADVHLRAFEYTMS